MSLLAIYTALRVANVVLAALVTCGLLARFGGFARAAWPSKVGRLTIFAWVTSTGAGTLEALGQQATPGYRIPAVTSVLLLSGYYVWTEWRDDRRHQAALTALAHLRDSDPSPEDLT